MCHASPGQVADATIAAMVPPPPQIEEATADWQPAQMHWIVRQGVKMSGMPAWPAEGRGDEVWAVVAFLAAVKRGMGLEDYAALTAPSPQGYCAGCHGSHGTVRAPRLDILSPEYIATALRTYRTGAWPSGIMSHAISQVDPAVDARLAAELSALSPPTGDRNNQAPVGDADALARSGAVDIPACLSCHGPRNANPLIPSLDGQGQAYLEQQLFLWRDGERGGGSRAVLMHSAAQSLSDQQIRGLAAYSRPGRRPGRRTPNDVGRQRQSSRIADGWRSETVKPFALALTSGSPGRP